LTTIDAVIKAFALTIIALFEPCKEFKKLDNMEGSCPIENLNKRGEFYQNLLARM